MTCRKSSNQSSASFLVVPAVEEEPFDLRLSEGLELAVAQALQRLCALVEDSANLFVRFEMLSTAGDDHLGVARRRLYERLEVLGGAVVTDAQGQFVEAVEEERDAALLEHIAECGQIDTVHFGLG